MVHSEEREALFLSITRWCDNYRDSDDGGYANVTPEDINELYMIIMCMVEHKCQADPDGDRPIEVHLTNRTQCWPSRFRDVPYGSDTPNEEVLQILLDNAQRANSHLCDFLGTWSANKLHKESE